MYYNVPKNAYDKNIQIGRAQSFSAGFNPSSNTLDVKYLDYIPHNSYIMFPTVGPYKFYETSKLKDTVDLSVMDTAEIKLFHKPFPIATSFRTVTGFARKDDNSSAIQLYSNSWEPDLTT